MYYKIKIEGGFTGIPKEYKGEKELGKSELESLLKALKTKRIVNEHLRDGLKYYIELQDEKGTFKAQFEEGNLPSEIRAFIGRIVGSEGL